MSEDQRALYVQRVEEIVPNIRYCAYNIGDTSDISQLVKLRTDTPGFDMLASKIDVCVNRPRAYSTIGFACKGLCYTAPLILASLLICLFVCLCFQQDVLSKTQEKAATSLTEVTWLDQRVPVKNEKLRVALIKLQQLEGELGRTASSDEKMEMYERLLMECQDSMQILREDLAAETVGATLSNVFFPS